MADSDRGEWDEHESSHHRLLIKLKTTVEGLLATHSAQGVWSTYGGLRRVCEDTENILCHGIKPKQAFPNSDGCFWAFVQGLKWLSPSLAPVIEKVAKHSQVRGGGAGSGQSEAGRAWLRDSVQDHSFVKQLDILLACKEHVHKFYREDAFLCQEKFVNAMKICFSAIEHNKPALLSDINPSLLKRLSKSEIQERRSTFPPTFFPEEKSATLPPAFSLPARGANRYGMGSKHSRNLEVNYPNLNNSTISLIVDPSIGFRNSPQKSPSQPQLITQDSHTVCSESVDNPQDWSEESVYTSATASSYETPTLLEEDLAKAERTNSASSGSNGIDFQSAHAGVPGMDMSSPLMYDDILESVSAIHAEDGNYKAIPHIQSADLGPRLLSPNSEDDFGLSSLNTSADDADVQDLDFCKPGRVDELGAGENKSIDCIHSSTTACDTSMNRILSTAGSEVTSDFYVRGENGTSTKLQTAHSLDQIVNRHNNNDTNEINSIRKSFSSSTDALYSLPNPSGSSQSLSRTSLDFNNDVISPKAKAGLSRVFSDTCIADNDPLSSSPSTTRQRSPFHSSSSNQDSDAVDAVDSPKELSTSNRSSGTMYIPPTFQRAFSVARSPPGSKSSTPPRANASGFKLGHKRSVSDTKAIQMGKSSQDHSVRPSLPSTSSAAPSESAGGVSAAVQDITKGSGARSSKSLPGHGHSASGK